MAVSLELENDELATLFFTIQQDDRFSGDPVMERLAAKMENLIFSRFSISEIEQYRKSTEVSAAEESLK
ncbi:MAG: hypothetical protein JXR86_05630 [Spirochaetales bacterium]|nr:hypothetical protein [Spirochaetales bacterium]